MKTTVAKSEFVRSFEDYDRVANFGYDGLNSLYEYLTELEQDTGIEVELDVIALCCDFTRYESLDEYNQAYGTDYTDIDDSGELACFIDNNSFIVYSH